MRTVCRFADGWDMSQPYIGCFVYRGAFSRVDCEERGDAAAHAGSYHTDTHLIINISEITPDLRQGEIL